MLYVCDCKHKGKAKINKKGKYQSFHYQFSNDRTGQKRHICTRCIQKSKIVGDLCFTIAECAYVNCKCDMQLST